MEVGDLKVWLKRLQDEFTVRMRAINAEAESAVIEESEAEAKDDQMESEIGEDSSIIFVKEEAVDQS
jgi:hypothetical protein